jgi:diguanylate cyclase (GGDEF)-like protein
VVEHGVPQLVRDELADPRIRQFASTGPVEGSIICVPLHGLDGVRGVLSLERLGTENRYDDEDFELVQLFATQVSIAIRNAEAYRAKEIEAETDDLTGLLNQGTFVDWLQRRVTAAEPFGLVVLDLDQFKNINDNHGHQAGDDVLRAVAGAIRGACRAGDLVFRWGGDEFTVICPAADAAGVLAAAERIQAAIGRLGAARLPTGAAPIAASIGVATFPEYGPSADEVLLAADRACFAAKRRGRNQVATAEDGLALAGDLTLQAPTPFDPPHPLEERRGT